MSRFSVYIVTVTSHGRHGHCRFSVYMVPCDTGNIPHIQYELRTVLAPEVVVMKTLVPTVTAMLVMSTPRF